MAVSVGYSIGGGYPLEISEGARVFSTVYILVGASGVAAFLAFFANSMIENSSNWYTVAHQQEKLKSASIWSNIKAWLRLNESAVKILLAWFVVMAALITFSRVNVQWDYTQAVYFALSCCSAGGMWPIPRDSPNWYFGVGECTGLVTYVQLWCVHFRINVYRNPATKVSANEFVLAGISKRSF